MESGLFILKREHVVGRGHVIRKRELEVGELSKYLYTCMRVSNNKKFFKETYAF